MNQLHFIYHLALKNGKLISIRALGLMILKGIYDNFKNRKLQLELESIRARKRSALEKAISTFMEKHKHDFQIDLQLKEEILNCNVQELKKVVRSERATISQILLIFIEQAVIQNKHYNFIAEVLFEEAYESALQQEQEYLQNSQVLDEELFGVPISIKEFIPVKGYDSHYGIAGRCFQPEPYDGYQVWMTRLARGIIFIKTTAPQMGKSIETYNHITGLTTNPHDKARTCGGSSGGEAAIIAAKASLLGIGTDIGGSIRIPAAFCGITGYKPSSARLHKYQKFRLTPKQYGWSQIKITAGPMARCVDDLALMMSVQLNVKYYQQVPIAQKDMLYRPIPFNYQIYNHQQRKLKIGVLRSLWLMPASDACQRVVMQVAQGLSQNGHEIIEFTLDDNLVTEGFELAFALLVGLDPHGEIFKEQIMGEQPIPAYASLYKLFSKPLWLRKFMANILNLLGEKRTSLSIQNFSKKYTASDFFDLLGRWDIFQEKFKVVWESQHIDALILPVAACPSFPHGLSTKSFYFPFYSTILNLLNYSAGAVPFSKVNQDEQNYYKSKEIPDKAMIQAMTNSIGLPLSVQVVTRPFDDELCLNIMKQIEQFRI